jgi:hypothetical protein
MPCHTKVAYEKTTAIPGGGISKKDSEVNKKSKVVQKQLAPKCTARPVHSQVNINSQYPVICANRLLSSLIKQAAVKNLNSLTWEMRRTMPYRRRTNLSLEIWILCSTPLIVCISRTPEIVAHLVRVLTSNTFSSWLQLRMSKCEYANYARKSCITCQQTLNNSILVTNMAMKKNYLQKGWIITCTSTRLELEIVVNTSVARSIRPSMTRLFWRKIGPTPSQLTILTIRLPLVNYANMHFLGLL